MNKLSKEVFATLRLGLGKLQEHYDTFDYAAIPCEFDMRACRNAEIYQARVELALMEWESSKTQ